MHGFNYHLDADTAVTPESVIQDDQFYDAFTANQGNTMHTR
jgi:hypothetical protein